MGVENGVMKVGRALKSGARPELLDRLNWARLQDVEV